MSERQPSPRAACQDNEPAKRPHYFDGMILTARDLRDEQAYYAKKNKTRNRCLYGYGVACGLEVLTEGMTLFLHPGFALDPCGNEIVVREMVELAVPEREGPLYVMIRYAEYETDPVPVMGDCASEEKVAFTRIVEGYEITFQPDAPCPGRECVDPHHPCAAQRAIPLAKLVRKRGRWEAARRFRRSTIRCPGGRARPRPFAFWR